MCSGNSNTRTSPSFEIAIIDPVSFVPLMLSPRVAYQIYFDYQSEVNLIEKWHCLSRLETQMKKVRYRITFIFFSPFQSFKHIHSACLKRVRAGLQLIDSHVDVNHRSCSVTEILIVFETVVWLSPRRSRRN